MPDFDPMPRDADARTRPHVVESREEDTAGGGGGRRPGGGVASIAIAVVLVAGLAALAWWKLRPVAASRPAAPAAALDGGAAASSAPAAPPATAPEPPLPPLDASDGNVRELGAGLSGDAAFAGWLGHDDLVRRFVAAVANVAEGASPASHVPFLRPSQPFRTVERGDRTVIDPATFRRHDLAVGALTSLDAAACARALRRLEPLFDAAWRELGDPRRDFRETLSTAISRLAAVPIPEGEIAVVPDGVVWAYADPELERRPAAEKLLLRMGPDHARRLRDWLRELAAARAGA
ncbi:MAG: hypothetical protein AMXMBFR36_18450 [Acidobacteriota bacterium]